VPERVAALYDIHGNLPALQAVVAELEQLRVDTILIGGDVVSGPMPRETVELLGELQPAPIVIRGNADREVAEWRRSGSKPAKDDIDAQRTAFAAARLDDEALALLASLPLVATMDVEELGRTLFCHATPSSDEETFTELSPISRIERLFGGVSARTTVCGHTHMQFDLKLPSGRRIANAGSVGQPYEGRRGAYWALLERGNVHLRRTDYDYEQAERMIASSGFPFADIHIADLFVSPPTREDALAVFEPAQTEG
jgi:predicted phosphodiesterase